MEDGNWWWITRLTEGKTSGYKCHAFTLFSCSSAHETAVLREFHKYSNKSGGGIFFVKKYARGKDEDWKMCLATSGLVYQTHRQTFHFFSYNYYVQIILV